MKDVLKKDSKGDDREKRHSKEGHVKIEEENITLLPQAKEHWEPPGAVEAKKDSLLEPPRGSGPVDTLTSDASL